MLKPTDPRLTDELTGLSNEWHFDILFDFAFVAGDRGSPLTVVLFEIEGFEAFRAVKGNEIAEGELRRFADLLAETTREMDLTARLGDARFVSLLRRCNPQGGRIFADRVQRLGRSIEEHGLRVAVGIAAHEKWMDDRGELMGAAEDALARALREESGAVHTFRGR